MARALVGYIGTPASVAQEAELYRLRARVRELQAEISELRGEASARRVLDTDHSRAERAVALT